MSLRRALAHASALGLKIARDRFKQVAVEPVRDKLAPEAHEGGPLGRCLVAGKPQKGFRAEPKDFPVQSADAP
jgi:hypothetical protein